ncbi:MAG: sugar-binding transcriptional regulator [Chloroflexota bacterium]
MVELRSIRKREELLADVAEDYYIKGQDQSEIARRVGVTRSMISRMLKEARDKGIVDIRIHRSVNAEPELEAALVKRFGLIAASVISIAKDQESNLLSSLGNAGALLLKQFLEPGTILGMSWGTSISATVDAFESENVIAIKIVQLVGALGSQNAAYDGHDLVLRMANKTGGEPHYLNAPFFCQDNGMARSLKELPGIQESVDLGKKTNVALLGIGSTQPKYSSFYLAGQVPIEDLDILRESGAIGDVCGIHFDVNGKSEYDEFTNRLVGIQKEEFFQIPYRIAVAGGAGKIMPVLGALRGGFINLLVTDSLVAPKVLELS